MTWAGKLFEKKISVPDNLGIKGTVVLIDGYKQAQNNLVLAVLEKNQEIRNKVKKGTNNPDYWNKEDYENDEQARAFREQVAEAEKRKGKQ